MRTLVLLAVIIGLGGCVSTAIGVTTGVAKGAVGVTKGTVSATGKVVGAAIPDGDDDDEDDR